MIPDTPPTITSRTSAAVGATRAMCEQVSFFSRTHSDPQRVFPKPRPASSIQKVQSPPGAIWFSRPQNFQSYSSALISSSDRSARIARRVASGCEASELASDAVSGIVHLNGATIFAGQLHRLHGSANLLLDNKLLRIE